MLRKILGWTLLGLLLAIVIWLTSPELKFSQALLVASGVIFLAGIALLAGRLIVE